jgi:hypothetical protein
MTPRPDRERPDPEQAVKKKETSKTEDKDKQGQEEAEAHDERYLFADYQGYSRSDAHLYLSTSLRKDPILTPGTDDEQLPAWSPELTHRVVGKRGGDPDRHWNWDRS